MYYKHLLLLLLFSSVWGSALAEIRYEGLSTRCLVKTQAENFMYAGVQISGGEKEVKISAQAVSQIANNQFIPQIEVKTFPEAVSVYRDDNSALSTKLETTLTLSEGLYTITVSPATAAEGIAIVNAYETQNTDQNLESISTRCYIGTEAENAMIAGIKVKDYYSKAEFITYRIDDIANNSLLPTLHLQTFPDGQFFTEANSLYNNQNSGYDGNEKLLHRIQSVDQGLYTATIQPSTQAGVGIVTVGQPRTIQPVEKRGRIGFANPIRMKFSPDNKYIASDIGSYIIVTDVETGENIFLEFFFSGIYGSDDHVYTPPTGKLLLFSPINANGQILTAMNNQGIIQFWNTKTAERLFQIDAQTTEATATFTADGEWFILANNDKTLQIWDVSEGKQIGYLNGNGIDDLNHVTASDDGKYIAAGTNSTIYIWELATRKQITTLSANADNAQFHPRENALLTAAGSVLYLWDIFTSEKIAELRGHTTPIIFFELVQKGSVVVSYSENETNTRYWNVNYPLDPLSATPPKPIILKPNPYMLSEITPNGSDTTIAFHSNLEFFAVTGDDTSIYFKQILDSVWYPQIQVEQATTITPTTPITDISAPTQVGESDANLAATASFTLSPDGRTAVIHPEKDTTIYFWDVVTDQKIGQLKGQTYYPEPMVFSPDGRILAFGAWDKAIQLWDVTTGKSLFRLEDNPNRVQSIAFSPDNQTVATGFHSDPTLRLWDVTTGQLKMTLEGHTAPVSSITFHPTENILITSSNIETGLQIQGTIKRWSATTGELLSSHQMGHVKSLVFSPDGNTLIVSENEYDIAILDTVTMNKINQLNSRFTTEHLAFSSDGKTLASSNHLDTELWNMDTNTSVAQVSGSGASQFVGNSTVLASSTSNAIDIKLQNSSELIQQDASTTIAIQRTLPPHHAPGNFTKTLHYNFSPDGRFFASGVNRYDDAVWLWDAVTGRKLFNLGKVYDYGPFKMSLDSLTYATQYAASYVLSLDFSSDGKILAESGSDIFQYRIMLWNTETGQKIGQLAGHKRRVKLVKFSPDGKILASRALSKEGENIAGNSTPFSDDKVIRLWDVTNQTEIRQINLDYSDDSNIVEQLEFSSDGKTLVAVFSDNVIRSWDVATGQLKVALTDNQYDTQIASLSSDATLMASTKTDSNAIQIWDITTGQLLQTLMGHSDTVDSLLFSLDNQTLISNSADSTILFWDIKTGRIRYTIPTANSFRSDKMQLNADGNQLAIVDSKGLTIQLWDISTYLK
ncbi:WD40 repeat domain-containing protein [Candidatus Albibeggiatoa sp. nov. NOAA]|uniref:WD40 repeat domain-containing protein n=1 Tax=Candidatus Albibeggiatoa sp. nov. NOAA TaxID=3162724 RepID=UPI0032F2BD90|nr:WD40 repeat domain-containing protein [Thiotrichaceae bacterium]